MGFPSLGLLIWVLIAGQSTNGASRWINLVGIQFQPSEIAKGAVVLVVAQILSAMQTPNGAERKAFKFKYVLTACSLFIILIGLENLSTAMLLCITILCMMIIGRVPMSQIGKLVGSVLIFICVVFAGVMIVGEDKENGGNKPENTLTENINEEQKKHQAWLRRCSTEQTPGKHVSTSSSIPSQWLRKTWTWIRMHRWHMPISPSPHRISWAKGPGNSVERDFLSQAFSDFIYAIIIEEMGLWGAFFVAFLYIILLFRAGRIANRCENTFPAFLCMGLAIMLVIQALFNMAVAVGLAPVTGQPLPLISRGGTSTIINCLYLGIILSISRTAKKKDLPQNEANFDRKLLAA